MEHKSTSWWCVLWGVRKAPFYSPRRSVTARIKYGNTGHHLQEDKDNIPAKGEAEWRRHGAGRPCGSADPWVSPLAPPFILDTALCMSVPGLCTSVFSVKWASFGCVTQATMFCILLLCLLRVFTLFPTCVPAINISPTLVKFVSNNSYHYCWCSFFMFLCRSWRHIVCT